MCEVCHEPVDLLSEYRDTLADKIYSPREHIEHQLNMTEEEKDVRRRFFTKLLDDHDAAKMRETSGNN